MARYVSVPTEVEAIQFTGNNWAETQRFCGGHFDSSGVVVIRTFNPINTYLLFNATKAFEMNVKGELWVEANHQWLPIAVDEWLIRDTLGYYPCKNKIFRKKYRPAD